MAREEETGRVNPVGWERACRDHAALARTATLLGSTRIVQTQDGFVRLIAERLW